MEPQGEIETHLAKVHLKEGCLLLYDVSSTYLEGKACPLAKDGYNREKKRSKLQIVFRLLCNDKACPIPVEVFEGNTSYPKIFTNQIDKFSSIFGIKRLVWVGDRGMITQASIREDLKDKEGLD
ncbi:Mobile element protein [Richelia intracellularis]|nr:Mobile element protein [Richelia intracellularis]